MRFWKRAENPQLVRIEQLLGEVARRLAGESELDARRAENADQAVRSVAGLVQRQDETLAELQCTLREGLQKVLADTDAASTATQHLSGDIARNLGRIEQIDGQLLELARAVEQAKAELPNGLAGIIPKLDDILSKLRSDLRDDRFRPMLDRIDYSSALVERLERGVVQGLSTVAVGAQAETVLQRVDQVAALAQRLDGDVVKGFAAVVQRLETDLVQLGKVVHRFDGQLADGLNAIPATIEGALNSTNGQSRIDARLDAVARAVQELVGLSQRLNGDVVNGFAGVVHRLETNLSGSGGRTEGLGLLKGTRAAASINSRLDAVAQTLNQVVEFAQRLDSDVGKGFGAIVERLERELGQVASMTEQLVRSAAEHGGLIAKLIVDQGRTPSRPPFGQANTNGIRKRSNGGVSVLSGSLSPSWIPLKDANLGSSLTHKLNLPRGKKAWVLNADALSTAPSGPQLIDAMHAARSITQPGDSLVWAQPLQGGPALNIDETRQTLGLLGPVDSVQDISVSDMSYRVAVGRARAEGLGIALRWSLPALEAFHLRLGPVMREALERFRLGNVLHGIDLPDPGADYDYWKQQIGAVAKLIAHQPGAALGIVLPLDFAKSIEVYKRAVADLTAALKEAGAPESTFQWVRGAVPVAASAGILDFARAHGLGFDFTPVRRGAGNSALEAYDDQVPYRPMDFDLRIPNFAPNAQAPLVLARSSGREIANNVTNAPSLPSLIDADFEQGCARVWAILDRAAQKQYELQVNLDPTLYSFWGQHFVYNWARPRGGSLRLVEFDAGDLTEAHSPLALLANENRLGTDDPRWKTGADFLALVDAVASESFRLTEEPKAIQIAEHQYQSERPDITADGDYLITWMPEKLGVTLELGCGLGVMARRIATRAQLYIGLDLTVAHAHAVQEAGSAGLVADIHGLPFGDDSIDTLIADNVIEHSLDPVRVLSECRRVLRPGGRAFVIIPYDFATSRFANRSHFWKADEASIRNALSAAGLEIDRQEKVRMAELGIPGAYPSCDGQTGLWMIRKPALTQSGAQRVQRK